MFEQRDSKAYLKSAQLLAATDNNSIQSGKYAEHILCKEGNINFQISADTFLGSTKTELLGCTILYLAYKKNKLKLFTTLLSHGIDFNIKNQGGLTVLHQITRDIYDKEGGSSEVKVVLDNPYITSILDALVKSENSSNTCDGKGITNFHVACMANHKASVVHFLKRKVPINQSVHEDSPIFAGYTAVHFAVRFSNLEVIKILFEYGAAPNIKDAKGMTPLHILINRNIEIADLLNKNEVLNAKEWVSQRKINEKIIDLLLSKCTGQIDVIDDTNLTRLHVACVIDSSLLTEDLLSDAAYINQAVNFKSPLFSGNTALHFAALCNIKKVKLLLKKGANIGLLNAKKQTAFDLCIERYNMKDIRDIISHQPEWRNVDIALPGKTLLDLFSCLETLDLSPLRTSQRGIKGIISNKSPIWSSYSLLHLAVVFSERGCKNDQMMIESIAGDLTTINRFTMLGMSPLHLAFRSKKPKVVDFLLRTYDTTCNFVDYNKLSHLHIACAAGNTTAVEGFLFAGAKVDASVQASFEWHRHSSTSRQVFIPKGSTPLHIAVIVGHCETMKLLMDSGADIYAEDEFGLTPVHWLIVSDNPVSPAADILLPTYRSTANGHKRFASSPLRECSTSTGLSHLHVACLANNVAAVEHVLKDDANVNARLLCGPDDDAKRFPGKFRYAGYTPLHFALEAENRRIVNLLIQYGAEVLMRNTVDNTIPLYEAFNDKYFFCSGAFISFFKSDKELQLEVGRLTGLTMLHFYCCILDEMNVGELLNEGAVDVNKSMRMDSPIWPGFTPLHVLIKFYREPSPKADASLDLLLKHGANVTALNAERNSPLHMAYDLDAETSLKVHILRKLLGSLKNFYFNAQNRGGLSHFLIACALLDLSAMRKFFERMVDVKQQIDYSYANVDSRGCTSLHLTLFCPLNQDVEVFVRLKAVSALIDFGADVHAENVLGNTPLHLAAKHHPKCINLLKRIVNAGSDIHAKNILGQTPMEILLSSKDVTVEGLEFFFSCGYSANAFDPITQRGFVAMAFSIHSHSQEKELLLELMLKAYGNEKDEMGRTVMHNIVSTPTSVISNKFYIKTIKALAKVVKINRRDTQGRTALHIATQFKNHQAVFALLQAGADINLTDANKKTAFIYAFETSPFFEDSEDDSKKVVKIFSSHIQCMNAYGFNVHKMNQSALAEAIKKYAVM